MSLKEIEQIIIPVDGSDSAGRAARFGVELAELVGAPATLLYAHPASSAEFMAWVGYPPVPEGFLQENIEAVLASMREAASRAFAHAREAVGETSVEIGEEVLEGTPAEAITAYASRQRAPLIVMGSRGLSPFKEIFLGSVSERVLRSASCPVSIVH